MKNVLSVVCVIASLALSPLALSADTTKPLEFFTKGDLLLVKNGVNLRKGIGLQMPVIRMTKGNEVLIADDNTIQEGFLRVITNEGTPAYVSARFLSQAVNSTAPATAPKAQP